MKFLKDKQGNKLTYSEYMQRWKSGIQSVTPLQQIKIQIRSTIIMLVGILAGIIVTLFNIKTLWWVLIILVGVFGVTSVQLLGSLQKKKALEDIEIVMKGGETK
ncbi:hypothetical protein LCGC14_0979970 [marine sediment metagenome]|uniref:Uncharacterized protein n=1 Tax=marine sediment metagenome TaxID=412755 RepID=A0A0F9N924_9ZZZZ